MIPHPTLSEHAAPGLRLTAALALCAAALSLTACLPVPVTVPPRLSPQYLGAEKWEADLGCSFKYERMWVTGPDGLRLGLTPRIETDPAALVLDLVLTSTSRRPVRVDAASLRLTQLDTGREYQVPLAPMPSPATWILQFEPRVSPPPGGPLRLSLPPVGLEAGMWQPGEVELRPLPATLRPLPFNC